MLILRSSSVARTSSWLPTAAVIALWSKRTIDTSRCGVLYQGS